MKSGIDEMKADIVRTVGQLCAAARKSGNVFQDFEK